MVTRATYIQTLQRHLKVKIEDILGGRALRGRTCWGRTSRNTTEEALC